MLGRVRGGGGGVRRVSCRGQSRGTTGPRGPRGGPKGAGMGVPKGGGSSGHCRFWYAMGTGRRGDPFIQFWRLVGLTGGDGINVRMALRSLHLADRGAKMRFGGGAGFVSLGSVFHVEFRKK